MPIMNVQGTGDNLPILRKKHRGIFNVHKPMLADLTVHVKYQGGSLDLR